MGPVPLFPAISAPNTALMSDMAARSWQSWHRGSDGSVGGRHRGSVRAVAQVGGHRPPAGAGCRRGAGLPGHPPLGTAPASTAADNSSGLARRHPFLWRVYPAPVTSMPCPHGGESVWRRSSRLSSSVASCRTPRCPVPTPPLLRPGGADRGGPRLGACELCRRHLWEGRTRTRRAHAGHHVGRGRRRHGGGRGRRCSRPPPPGTASSPFRAGTRDTLFHPPQFS